MVRDSCVDTKRENGVLRVLGTVDVECKLYRETAGSGEARARSALQRSRLRVPRCRAFVAASIVTSAIAQPACSKALRGLRILRNASNT